MNEEMIRRLGELATALLTDQRFEALVQLHEQQIACDMLETKPDQPEERERLYMTLRGARNFQNHLALFAEKFRELTAPAEDAATDFDDP